MTDGGPLRARRATLDEGVAIARIYNDSVRL